MYCHADMTKEDAVVLLCGAIHPSYIVDIMKGWGECVDGYEVIWMA